MNQTECVTGTDRQRQRSGRRAYNFNRFEAGDYHLRPAEFMINVHFFEDYENGSYASSRDATDYPSR